MNGDREQLELSTLIGIFFDDESLGHFEEISSESLPDAERRLLDHHSHMTVALEEFHGSRLDLHVLAVRQFDSYYARKIALMRRTDGRAVLFGIVRLITELLPPEAMAVIRQQTTPLGHVLIRQNVMREVERLQLWRIQPGAELQQLFRLPQGKCIYGRTALIYCNSQPAIELLEIVAVP